MCIRDRLLPVQRAAEHCGWLKAMVEAGEIYQPLRWTPTEAMQFLRDVPALEKSGIVVRMPASWRMNRPARPQVKTTFGAQAPSHVGLDAVLDFDMAVTLDGDALTAAEIKTLLAQSDGLAFIRGQWVEINHELPVTEHCYGRQISPPRRGGWPFSTRPRPSRMQQPSRPGR